MSLAAPKRLPASSTRQRQSALSNWDNEGGASPDLRRGSSDDPAAAPADAAHMQLHIRVIALEHLVISLLAAASAQQLDAARELAACITPRPGRTPHRLTIHAAARMIHVVERADRLRLAAPP
ncbi:MAG TPA: hypothetical protein VLI72_06010 [Methylibium sp.]|nr:hypothetical protein [Methylibium sp.]